MDLEKRLYSLHPFLLSSIAGVMTVAQIFLALFLPGNSSTTVQWIGWICLWVSAIFGMLPVITFLRKGGVAKGESYIKTSILVDTGIYAIVRHPQGGTAWLLINLGVMLVTWHWVTAALGIASMVLVYADTYKADQDCIEKFGDPYKQYIQKVPRVNFLLGILRLIKNKRSE